MVRASWPLRPVGYDATLAGSHEPTPHAFTFMMRYSSRKRSEPWGTAASRRLLMVSAGEGAMAPLGRMDLDEFRRGGHRIVDWITDYRTHPERYPVLSRCRPGEVRAQLPMAAPSKGESIESIVNDFERVILPGITHWNHPAFFAYFGITGSGPGIVGELIAAALNVNAMLWRTSPAATELEQRTLAWVAEMLGLPGGWVGDITDTASASTLYALAAAREAAGWTSASRAWPGAPACRRR